MTITTRYCGIDVGRSSIYCCVLTEEPGDLQEFANRYKPVILETSSASAEQLLKLADIYFLEPTGADYWYWVNILEEANAEYRLVAGTRIRNYARIHGITSKGDREDAAAICCYGMIHLQKGKESAFLQVNRSALHQHWLTLRTLPKISTAYQNKLRARLAFESPEVMKIKACDRDWGSENPSRLWRQLAGEEGLTTTGRKRNIQTTVAAQSWITEEIAKLLCAHEEFQGRVERFISKEVEDDDSLSMQVLQAVFDQWKIPERASIAIIAAVHPIEQFLGEDGQRIRKRKWNQAGTKRGSRDASLKSFQRAMAFGLVKIQSGQKMIQVPTGDKYVKSSMLTFLSARIVIGRQPQTARLHKVYGKPEEWENWKKKQKDEWKANHSFKAIHQQYGDKQECWNNPEAIASVMMYNGCTEPFAKLQLFYEFAPQCQNLRRFPRIKKVYSKFIRALFRDLVECYRVKKN